MRLSSSPVFSLSALALAAALGNQPCAAQVYGPPTNQSNFGTPQPVRSSQTSPQDAPSAPRRLPSLPQSPAAAKLSAPANANPRARSQANSAAGLPAHSPRPADRPEATIASEPKGAATQVRSVSQLPPFISDALKSIAPALPASPSGEAVGGMPNLPPELSNALNAVGQSSGQLPPPSANAFPVPSGEIGSTSGFAPAQLLPTPSRDATPQASPQSAGTGGSTAAVGTPVTDQGPGVVEWTENLQPGRVSLHAENTSLVALLRMIAQRHQLNLVVGPGVGGSVTLSIDNADLHQLLTAILTVNGHTWHQADNLLYVTALNTTESGTRPGAHVQGRVIRVFPLDYVAAADVQPVIEGILSAVGQVFITESDSADTSRTREMLVVEDVAAVMARVELVLAEIDQPPRQVLIEAHVLQVVLDDLTRHGINLSPMARLGNGSVTFETLGFANDAARTGMKVSLNGQDIQGLVELIQTQTDSRTLASPKVLAVNRQESNIQIGKRLSYLTTTVTQTASVQSVQFLDTGVVLNVTPTITADGQVLMNISPKVSGGQLNPETELPEEESTELSTTVLLPDGGGVIIGGLIKDEDIDSQSRVPGFSKIPLLGHLFRRHEVTKKRTEIIVALTANIQPTPEMMRQHEMHELQIAVPPYAAVEMHRPLPTNMAQPPAYQPPAYQPPAYQPPAYQPLPMAQPMQVPGEMVIGDGP